MSKPAAPALKDVRFHNPRLARVGVEALTLQALRERAGATLGAPERVDFHLLLLVQAGRSTHRVDFVEFSLQPGTVLLVRAGQVHQWRMTGALQGQLLLITAQALAPAIARAGPDMQLLALDEWPTASRPGPAPFAQALAGITRLHDDIARFADQPVESAIVRHELMALLLRLAREHGVQAGAPQRPREAEIHRVFARELEAGFTRRLSVQDYARRTGYSESTLSRACLATTGCTAKQAIDQRIALEAKRLLVHSDLSAAQIGHRLGFSEATNFLKFFKRMAGDTPLGFRRAA